MIHMKKNAVIPVVLGGTDVLQSGTVDTLNQGASEQLADYTVNSVNKYV